MLFALMLAMAAQAQDAKCDHAREAALQEAARSATTPRHYAPAPRRVDQAATACPEPLASALPPAVPAPPVQASSSVPVVVLLRGP